MSQTYKITLKPLGAFYFGGEESFSSALLDAVHSQDKNAKEYFKKRQEYFAKGEMFPQQTQLLGMIRKELLRINKKLYYFKNFVRVPKEFESTATEIVGKGRWSLYSKLNLGEIENISPIYLQENDKLYISAPYDFGLSLQECGKSYINGKEGMAIAFQKEDKEGKKYFGAKDYLCNDFISKDKDKLYTDKIFKHTIQTQTQTLNYKEDNDEQLFKVKKYYLKKEFSFVFYLTLKSDEYLSELETTVEIGGERSVFSMQVAKSDMPDIQKDFSWLGNDISRIVLTSNTFIESDVFEKCKIVLAKKKAFRTLKSGIKFGKTAKVVLLSRGSVLYPKEEQQQNIISLIQKHKNFTTIGYNQYLDLTKGATNV